MAALPAQPRIHIITQARMTSTRLPGKIMIETAGKTMLEHHVHRLQKAGHPVIIATTINCEDNPVETFAEKHNLACYRGDEYDVLGRFYEANQQFPGDIIVRVTSDCPLIDSTLIQQGIDTYLALNDDQCYVSNCFPRTYARGFDFEIFSARMLQEANRESTSTHDREHVTPFMRAKHSERMHNIAQEKNNGSLRLTLDTPEDLLVLKHMIEETPALELGFAEIEILLLSHPEWITINEHIEQKKT
jgi:spore coat polysaccharide biosynthesis protein SpsF